MSLEIIDRIKTKLGNFQFPIQALIVIAATLFFYSTVNAAAPQIILSKTVDSVEASPGDTLTYTISYQNTGIIGATGIVLTDTLPVGVTYESAYPSASAITGNIVRFNLPDLPPATSGSRSIKVKIASDVADKTILANNATLTYTDKDGNIYPPISSGASTTVKILPVPPTSKEKPLAAAAPKTGSPVALSLSFASLSSLLITLGYWMRRNPLSLAKLRLKLEIYKLKLRNKISKCNLIDKRHNE